MKCRRQVSISTFASGRLRNHSKLRHSSRNLSLKLSFVAFCHGLPGSMSACINAAGAQPLKDRPGDELRAVVRTQVARCTLSANEPRQHVDDVPRSNAARDLDGKALTCPLVDDGQTLQLLAVGATVVHEVIGPDMIGGRRWCRPWPPPGDPAPWPSSRDL